MQNKKDDNKNAGGFYNAGSFTPLQLNYNSGPSEWKQPDANSLALALDNNKNTDQPITFVGGGFTGTTLLIHTLLKIAEDPTITTPVKITLIEKKPQQMHGGVAYGHSTNFRHNLNLSSRRITPFPEKKMPEKMPTFPEFVQQRAERDYSMMDNLQNPARKLYGEYLKHLLDLAIQKARGKAEVTFSYNNVIASIRKHGYEQLICENGPLLEASHAILTTGHRDVLTPSFAHAVAGSPLFQDTPYSTEANPFFDKVARKPYSEVLIIGSGLTADDIAARLILSGHKGKITMISRHASTHAVYADASVQDYLESGLPGEPRAKDAYRSYPQLHTFLKATTTKQLVREVSKSFTALKKKGFSSEEILSSWEKFVPDIVEKFPKDEIAGLLRKYGSVIVANRVGVTPKIGNIIHDAIESGQLNIMRGDIHEISEYKFQALCHFTPFDEKGVRADKADVRVFDYVFSSMGNINVYTNDTSHVRDPFWRDKMENGLAKPHWTGFGVTVARDFSLCDEHDTPSPYLSVVGVPTQGHMMVTKYPYPEKPGAGGRLGPFSLNIPGITGACMAFLDQKYDSLVARYRTEKPAAAKRANPRPAAF